MERYPPSQEEVIAAFLKWLNAEHGATYEIAACPDKTERRQQAIDYVLRDRNTGQEIAVEVSSIWRSKDAGMEDANFGRWFERARARVRGCVRGTFYVTMPIRIPDGTDARAFGDALIGVIQREAPALFAASNQGRNLGFKVAGIPVQVYEAKPTGSDVDFARVVPDMTEFPQRIRSCLDDKAPKLKPYSDQSIETWIVVYNTIWLLMSPYDVIEITSVQCGPQHSHVSHIGVCAGNPPDDAWVIVAR